MTVTGDVLGYYNGGSGVCSNCAAKCKACSAAAVCTECFSGDYLKADKSCADCPANCTKCAS